MKKPKRKNRSIVRFANFDGYIVTHTRGIFLATIYRIRKGTSSSLESFDSGYITKIIRNITNYFETLQCIEKIFLFTFTLDIRIFICFTQLFISEGYISIQYAIFVRNM